jgi:peptidoglycan/xylan/chitin deacetylase (PgdA/CDA1 family)
VRKIARGITAALAAASILVPMAVLAGVGTEPADPSTQPAPASRAAPDSAAKPSTTEASSPPVVPAAGSSAVPVADWATDEFTGPAHADWLLGDPYRLVPRPKGPPPPRLPRGLPYEGGFPGRRLLLTFDDGPIPDATPRLLEILRQERVPAVFFLVGSRIDEVPQRRQGRRIVQQILADGHEVGNHSMNHPHLTELGEAGWKPQVLLAHQAIRSATGFPPTLFRAPYGQVNGAIDRFLTYRGYTRLHWTYVADEFRGRSPELMVRGILEQIRERERGGRNVGGVLLLHESHERSIDCAGLLIRRMKAENCALLDAGDTDIWRFVAAGAFFVPQGGAALDDAHTDLRASDAEVEAARTWCTEHVDELPQIRSLDALTVDIEDPGFGRVDGYGPPDVTD